MKPPTPRSRSSPLGPALVLFTIMVAHGLLETARDALFLTHLGPDRLAWAYLAIAACALGAIAGVRRLRRRADPRSLLIGFLIVAALGTGVLAAMIALAPSIVFVLYVWTGFVATLIVPSFWLVVDRSVRLADAKRLFAAFAAAGVGGALVGSALATGLTLLVAPQQLVFLAAVVLGLAAISAIVIAPRVAHTPITRLRRPRADESQRTRGYVRLLLVGGVLATVTLTLGDLTFKRMLAERLAANQIAGAIGAIYTGFNLVALVVQLAVTPRLIARLGVGSALLVLPAIVLATALGFVASGTLIAIVALKIGDGGLRHSVHRVATEILMVPLATRVRDVAKPVVDVVGQRGGQVLAALLTLSIATSTTALGIMMTAVAVLWLFTMALTRMAYVQQFRDTIDAGDIQRNAMIATLDSDGVALLTGFLSSPDETEALAAIDLLARRGTELPALVLYHPSPAVVRRALSLLKGEVRGDVERVLGNLTTHPAPDIRAAALAASTRTSCNQDRLTEALHDPEPEVRATAAVGLVDMIAVAELAHGSSTDQIALAKAIGRVPHAQFREHLDKLVESEDWRVVREVVDVWARAPELANTPRLIRLLEDPYVRGDVRRAIAAAGTQHLAALIAALDDPDTSVTVRRHLPRTISRFGTPAAASALLSRLVREPDGTTEFKLLRALGRMRTDAPKLVIDRETVRLYVKRATEEAVRYGALADQLGSARPDDAIESSAVLLLDLLSEKRDHAIERVFRALGVLHPNGDLRSLHTALIAHDDERNAAAREVLEDLLPAATRIILLDLVAGRFAAKPRTYEEVLGELLEDASDSLRCVAVHHVAERRLVALRPQLEKLRPSSIVVTQAFDQALGRLDD